MLCRVTSARVTRYLGPRWEFTPPGSMDAFTREHTARGSPPANPRQEGRYDKTPAGDADEGPVKRKAQADEPGPYEAPLAGCYGETGLSGRLSQVSDLEGLARDGLTGRGCVKQGLGSRGRNATARRDAQAADADLASCLVALWTSFRPVQESSA